MLQNEKLYIVVRKDLEPGLQMAQSCHCAFEFAKDYPSETNSWMSNSNYIAVLNCADEHELLRLIEQARLNDIKFSIFREPDIENQVTSVAFEPGIKSKKLCTNLKLALKMLQ